MAPIKNFCSRSLGFSNTCTLASGPHHFHAAASPPSIAALLAALQARTILVQFWPNCRAKCQPPCVVRRAKCAIEHSCNLLTAPLLFVHDGVRWCVGTTRASAPQHTKRDPRAHHIDSHGLGQSTHCRTVSRSCSDGRCGEPECLARGVRPVECTQKRTDIRHAKYEARTLAGRAATLPVRSQIERFGQTCDGEPATGQRADGLLAQDWQDGLICIMSERLQTFTAGARA